MARRRRVDMRGAPLRRSPVTKEDRARLRALVEAATPGPWQESRFVHHRKYSRMSAEWVAERYADEACTVRGPGEVGTGACNPVAKTSCKEDASFIAASRTAVPALLDEVERLEAALRAAVDTGHNAAMKVGADLEERIASLEAERDRLKEKFDTAMRLSDVLFKERDEAEATVARLRAALEKYGSNPAIPCRLGNVLPLPPGVLLW